MSATIESDFKASAWMTSWGFCHASRSGSSKTFAHFSASPKRCWCVCGVCAAAGIASRTLSAAVFRREKSFESPITIHHSRSYLEVHHHPTILVLQIVTVDHVDLVAEEGVREICRDAHGFARPD